MKKASVLVQFALLIIGIALLFVYVRPAFSSISEDQDTLSEYSNAIEEATEVNLLLDNLIASVESISSVDREALDRYVDQSPVLLVSLAQADGGETSFVNEDSDNNADTLPTGETVDPNTQIGNLPVNEVHFNLSVTGNYSDIKNLLSSIEMNSYPIHLQSISLTASETGDLQAEMTFVTYGFNDEQS